jgi:hypothetical protein
MDLVNVREKLSFVSYFGIKNKFKKICVCPEALWGREVDCDGSGWELGN